MTSSFERFAGRCAVLAGLAGLLYAIALVIIARSAPGLGVLYRGRLVVLTPTSLFILVPALLTGFVVNPAWYIWLGLVLLRGRGG